MYAQEYLAKERYQERLRQAEGRRAASQAAEKINLPGRSDAEIKIALVAAEVGNLSCVTHGGAVQRLTEPGVLSHQRSGRFQLGAGLLCRCTCLLHARQ